MAFHFSSFDAGFVGVSQRFSFLRSPVFASAFLVGLVVVQGCTLAVTANNTQAEAEPDTPPEPEVDGGRIVDAGGDFDAGDPLVSDAGQDAASNTSTEALFLNVA
ncbi:MAG: hypothetical protein GY822_20540 [Deltaproteobacteria bacterium]|nr:hypothetical protein [Deltaproteobacteria bacterium]